jgi:hypothetical protein
MLCGVNAFKAYCTFGFWKSTLVLDDRTSRDPALQFGRIEKRCRIFLEEGSDRVHSQGDGAQRGRHQRYRARQEPAEAAHDLRPALEAALTETREAQATRSMRSARATSANTPSGSRRRRARTRVSARRQERHGVDDEGKARNWKYEIEVAELQNCRIAESHRDIANCTRRRRLRVM